MNQSGWLPQVEEKTVDDNGVPKYWFPKWELWLTLEEAAIYAMMDQYETTD